MQSKNDRYYQTKQMYKIAYYTKILKATKFYFRLLAEMQQVSVADIRNNLWQLAITVEYLDSN